MYYQDLSEYKYLGGEQGKVLLNVGWLAKDKPFSTGEVSVKFEAKLRELCESPVRLGRGFFRCPFCVEDVVEGNGEIRVKGVCSTFASPALIHHYVTVHNYLPPNEFVLAVHQLSK